MKPFKLLCLSAALLVSPSLWADDGSELAVKQLQHNWAINNYQLSGDEQEKAFVKLLKLADESVQSHPQSTGVRIWHGIINSTYAGVSGGLGALKYAKRARSDFEQALKQDPTALKGSAYTSLGVLYYKVPGWPLGFGDDDKAEELLKQALELNPDGIDSNYFYGDFLLEEDRYDEALPFLQKALEAAPRPGRELADAGRKQEIKAALARIAAYRDNS
ncbi:tetratricopeptide repeat protein [Shewanella algae]|uniref:tetratricopeptide repeat protein n=1 Tax=Shewanella algae TaxID=38313 RepID=UPI00313BCD74